VPAPIQPGRPPRACPQSSCAHVEREVRSELPHALLGLGVACSHSACSPRSESHRLLPVQAQAQEEQHLATLAAVLQVVAAVPQGSVAADDVSADVAAQPHACPPTPQHTLIVFNLFALEAYHVAEGLGLPAAAAAPYTIPSGGCRGGGECGQAPAGWAALCTHGLPTRTPPPQAHAPVGGGGGSHAHAQACMPCSRARAQQQVSRSAWQRCVTAARPCVHHALATDLACTSPACHAPPLLSSYLLQPVNGAAGSTPCPPPSPPRYAIGCGRCSPAAGGGRGCAATCAWRPTLCTPQPPMRP